MLEENEIRKELHVISVVMMVYALYLVTRKTWKLRHSKTSENDIIRQLHDKIR